MSDKVQVLFIIPMIGVGAGWEDRYANAWDLYGKLLRNCDRIIIEGHDYFDIFRPDVGVVVSHPASPGVNGIANWFPTEWLARPAEDAALSDKADWFDDKIQDFRDAGREIRGAACELATAWLTSHNYSIVGGGA